jgi:hypothetical protein
VVPWPLDNSPPADELPAQTDPISDELAELGRAQDFGAEPPEERWEDDADGDGHHLWRLIGRPGPGETKWAYIGHRDSVGNWHPPREDGLGSPQVEPSTRGQPEPSITPTEVEETAVGVVDDPVFEEVEEVADEAPKMTIPSPQNPPLNPRVDKNAEVIHSQRVKPNRPRVDGEAKKSGGRSRQKSRKSTAKSTTKPKAKPLKKSAKVRTPDGYEARPRDNRWQLFRLNGKKLSSKGKEMWDRTYIGSFTEKGLQKFYERETQNAAARQPADRVLVFDPERGRRPGRADREQAAVEKDRRSGTEDV